MLFHFNDDLKTTKLRSEWPVGPVVSAPSSTAAGKCDAQIGGAVRAEGRPVVIRALSLVIRALSPKGLAVILGDNSGAPPSLAWLRGIDTVLNLKEPQDPVPVS